MRLLRSHRRPHYIHLFGTVGLTSRQIRGDLCCLATLMGRILLLSLRCKCIRYVHISCMHPSKNGLLIYQPGIIGSDVRMPTAGGISLPKSRSRPEDTEWIRYAFSAKLGAMLWGFSSRLWFLNYRTDPRSEPSPLNGLEEFIGARESNVIVGEWVGSSFLELSWVGV